MSKLLSDLLEQGLIEEVMDIASGKGRPGKIFRLAEQFAGSAKDVEDFVLIHITAGMGNVSGGRFISGVSCRLLRPRGSRALGAIIGIVDHLIDAVAPPVR